ncbi:MAG: UDP-N-acetylmuramate:L-alanyl-gamma-D-glutamyl-meso-diaminopimelate ligase [Gammaproteobacteria bacterium]|nr:UDP-N-acetylmuramate:L-alanyl-gamma-D-glutamyl-meso-diaminopimelate ligase [Gammaproteobacteria bacterium]
MHIHILGICGTFMGSLALLAKESDHRVTGSDINCYPPISDQLDEMGIEVIPNYDIDQLKLEPDLIVIGNVMTRGMDIIEQILDNGLAYTSGPEWLGQNILADRKVISVAGTHGKTTTSSIIASALMEMGQDPGYLIGGVPINFDASASLGSSEYFVIEADEYDTAFFDKRSKFIHYPAQTLVINNLEFDHADIFKDLEQIKWHFHQLIRSLSSKVDLRVPYEDQNIRDLLAMGNWSTTKSFGFNEKADFAVILKDGNLFVKEGDDLYEMMSPRLFGKHNLMNIISAFSALRSLGFESEKILKAVEKFDGVKRRLQRLNQFDNNAVFDDFAHHPTAINFAIDAIKDKYPNKRLCVLAELASNTMRQGTLKDEVVSSFSKADCAFIISNDNFEWDIEDAFKPFQNINIVSSHQDLMKDLESIDTDDYNFLIMTNRTSIPFIEALEKRL